MVREHEAKNKSAKNTSDTLSFNEESVTDHEDTFLLAGPDIKMPSMCEKSPPLMSTANEFDACRIRSDTYDMLAQLTLKNNIEDFSKDSDRAEDCTCDGLSVLSVVFGSKSGKNSRIPMH